MDPTKCLTEILEELSQMNERSPLFDLMETAYSLRTLAQWIDRGGFPPDVDEAISDYWISDWIIKKRES